MRLNKEPEEEEPGKAEFECTARADPAAVLLASGRGERECGLRSVVLLLPPVASYVAAGQHPAA